MRRPASAPGRRAFTLLELLVVLAIVGVLSALLFPALARGKQAVRRVACVSNLRQLGLAARMYWDDWENLSWRYRGAATNGGDIWWFGWLERWNGANEGQRAFDPSLGALYPYLQGRGIETCPSFDYSLGSLKLKATGASYGYGYNRHLSGVNVNRVTDPSGTVLLADSAQVNDFQAPAAPDNPMLEEFYYVSSSPFEATAHFRHSRTASALFCDGHVEEESPCAGSLDPRLPSHHVGRLRPERVRVP